MHAVETLGVVRRSAGVNLDLTLRANTTLYARVAVYVRAASAPAQRRRHRARWSDGH